MQPGDRVKWGELYGTVVSRIRTTCPFEPRDRCHVSFDGGFHEWVDTSALSKTASNKRPLLNILKENVRYPEPSQEFVRGMSDAYSELRSFHALDWFHLTGRGDVAVVILDRDCQRSEMLTLFARVRIDGTEYTVKGVESFAVERQRKWWTIGLLVERKISGEA